MNPRSSTILVYFYLLLIIALILYIFYFKDQRLAYFLLGFMLCLFIFKIFMLNKYKNVCKICKKFYCGDQ